MKCKAAKHICQLQLTQYAMHKYACTTRDDIDLHNNKMEVREQFIPLFDFPSPSSSHAVTNR